MAPNMSAAASKAVLRDCKRRLQSLRKECGCEDAEEPQSTGDPFTDLVVAFNGRIKDAEALLEDEASAVEGDGTEAPALRARVDAAIIRLDHDLEEMNNMVYDAESAFARAEVKKKSATKIQKRRQIYEQKKQAFQECQSMVLSIKKMREEYRRGRIKRPPITKQTRKRVKQLAAAQAVLAQGNKQAEDITARSPAFGLDSVDLRAEAETKQIMREIDEEKKKIDKGLQLLVQQVAALKQLALKIGDEIDAQGQQVEVLSQRIEKSTDDVRRVTEMQKKFLENQSPLNTCGKAFLVVIFLGLLGYLLFKVGVIPS